MAANWFTKLNLVLIIRCEQVAELTSDAQDRRLHWHERLAVRGHQISCWSCRQFEKHLQFLSQAMIRLKRIEQESVALSELRMPATLRDKLAQISVVGTDGGESHNDGATT